MDYQNRFRIEVYPDRDALVRAGARYFLGELFSWPATGNRWCVALSGGRVAPKLFESIVRESKACSLPWEQVEFFFADERWVPLNSEESNYRLARRHLFEPLAISPTSVHPLYYGISPAFDAAQAQGELIRRAPATAEGDPVLDLVVLGMGEDGHIASLFPGLSETMRMSGAVYLPVTAPKPPSERITLTYRVLGVARRVLVIISGPGKESALRDSLLPGSRTPLGELIARRDHTLILTDLVLA